jgi:rfaE bifunctional protein kinase chain/domain
MDYAQNGRIIDRGEGSCEVLVIGDLILDRYVSGTCSRISPEAPVPVMVEQKVEHRAGGAANVALNIAAFGVDLILYGIAGRDEEAEILIGLLDGIKCHVQREEIPTTLKTRFVIDSQQVLRIDREEKQSRCVDILKHISWHSADFVVVSDYAKHFTGMIPTIIKEVVSRGAFVIVDPKSPDWEIYRGAALITPNLKEFEEAGGQAGAGMIDSCLALRKMYGIDSILVTMGDQGMVYSGSEGFLTDRHRQFAVADTTGAGDTAVAAFTAGLVRNLYVGDCLRGANLAAGYVCQKDGTSVVKLSGLPPSLAKLLETKGLKNGPGWTSSGRSQKELSR